MTETGTYLYGIARDLDPNALQEVRGVAGASVRTVANGGLIALVSTVSLDEFGEEALHDHLEDLDWLENVARAHHRVVDAASAVAPTAPTRLATIYRGDERVRQLLEERQKAFDTTLSRIGGRAEWGVKAYVDPQTSAQATTEDAPAYGSASPGTAYLMQRRAQQHTRQEAWQNAAARGEEIDTELRRVAEASRRHPPQDPQLSGRDGWMVLNGAYLVDADRAGEFTSMFTRLTERHPDVELELTGPWAPYSFAGEDA
ncbi:MAG: gas vesicle synthesis GvpLF [Streptosporangiales bacterium]|nr:gas vesicle synthesis GvpLF [Streptosporangiales bacterium]